MDNFKKQLEESRKHGRETRLRLKFEILVGYKEEPNLSMEEMAEKLKLSNKQALLRHVSKLREEGMLVEEFRKNGPRLTQTGELVLKYAVAGAEGEPLLSQMFRKHFGGSARVYTIAVNAVVERLDRDYKLNRDEMFVRRGRLNKLVLDRKTSATDVIKAARKYSSAWIAASSVGLLRGAYEQRLEKIFQAAKESLQ